ncbi:MAG: metal ABC transporter permease [Deltaproteobacteria bacterium]|nr:metal ABC transporter permease [Deltaproteobacteria bacterium]
MNALELMAAPFVECLVLVAVHTYLGIHVLKRRVIFVDLALAQTAALGTTVGFFFGIMPETPGAFIFSIGFALLGAAIFAVTRFRHEQVPQEAIIGLAYAVTCAMAVLVVDKTQGAEHLKDILVGNLLWVTWKDVAVTAIAYVFISIVHFVLRKQFLLISENPKAAYRAGMAIRAWDFLFYATFALVITLSTRVAGVLMVFVFLVAPAILAFAITSKLWLQLVIGWAAGTLVTVLGLYLSWALDLPSGPAVIGFYGVALVLSSIVIVIARAPDRGRTLLTVGAGTVVAALIGLAIYSGGKWMGSQSIAISDEARQVEAEISIDQAAAASRESREQSSRHRALEARIERCVGHNKIDRYLSLAGPEEQLAHIRAKLGEEQRRGLEFLLIALADDELPLLYREEAVELLKQAAGDGLGYDPQVDVKQNEPALAKLCDHVRALKKTNELEPDREPEAKP